MNTKNRIYKFLSTERWNDSAIFFLRIFAGILMLSHGIEKINNYEMLFTTFPDILGMGSSTSLLLITGVEVIGSLLLIVGLLVRPAALVLAISMLVAIFASPEGSREMPLLYMGIFVGLLISGGMRYSLDRVFFKV